MLCGLKSADHVFMPPTKLCPKDTFLVWSCFPAKNHMWQAKPYSAKAGKSPSAKEYIYVWLVIHYLDFDSVAPYYVCSPQLEIVN